MARFKCEKARCKKTFKTPQALGRHFRDTPEHRTEEQQELYERRLLYASKRRVHSGLPTVSGTHAKLQKIFKHCTQCGTTRKPSYVYCGVCGRKLAS